MGEVHSNGSSHRRDKKCKFLQKKIYHKPSCDEADEPVRNGQNLNEEKNAEGSECEGSETERRERCAESFGLPPYTQLLQGRF